MKRTILLTCLFVFILTGCSTLEIGIEPRTDIPATAFPFPIATTQLPNLTAQPSATPTDPEPTAVLPQSTATQVPPSETPGHQLVKIFLIAVDDNGQSGDLVGCGDSVVPVEVEISPSKDVLKMSIEALLLQKAQFYGESGLYNALYQSDLSLKSLTLENGRAEIALEGSLILGGVCDNPRVKAQLEATAYQFSTVNEVMVYINGQPLDEVLSLQGYEQLGRSRAG